MDQQDFYIGWMSKAPKSFAKHVKKVLLILFPAALIVAYLLSTSQKKFSTANFEFGKLTEVKGIYYNKPVPMLKVLVKTIYPVPFLWLVMASMELKLLS